MLGINSVKNYADAINFRTAICAEASQSCIDCRAKSDILLAVNSRQVAQKWRISVKEK